ncbi:MAG: pirin family protein [Clostridiales bacterium]|nr:pirin family protein [Clostridiales bacterium]
MGVSAMRKIKRVVTGSTQYDGAGVKLVRVIGNTTVVDFDPFLMLDAFDSIDPQDYIKGFPWHPHRGIETVTYLINGCIEHGDSLSNSGTIGDGCCQWMTAGSGILHQEMPKTSPRMLGVQLWLNLPKKDKMTTPQYRDIKAEMVPLVEMEGTKVRIISGEYQQVAGPSMGDYVKTLFLDVAMEKESTWQLRVDSEATLFIYIVEGSGCFDDGDEEVHMSRRAILFEQGDTFFAKAGDEGLRFFLFSGKPLKEPIAWGGPIVMNTREELEHAFLELEQGTFIKSK